MRLDLVKRVGKLLHEIGGSKLSDRIFEPHLPRCEPLTHVLANVPVPRSRGIKLFAIGLVANGLLAFFKPLYDKASNPPEGKNPEQPYPPLKQS